VPRKGHARVHAQHCATPLRANSAAQGAMHTIIRIGENKCFRVRSLSGVASFSGS